MRHKGLKMTMPYAHMLLERLQKSVQLRSISPAISTAVKGTVSTSLSAAQKKKAYSPNEL
jgi:hypothetical protein